MSSQPADKRRIAVYTGSFDPITLGHLNVIERASRLVDCLIVGIGINVGKPPLFSPAERVAIVQQVTEPLGNVEVRTFEGLAVRFVRECGARVMVRGIRPLTDIAAEFTMMLANRELDPDVETVFFMADQRYAHVSSTLIKQIAPLADDAMLARFVPAAVITRLRKKLAKNRRQDPIHQIGESADSPDFA
jgi:pantetheine-phosphate adenylyltransferase